MILQEIIAYKKREVALRKKVFPLTKLLKKRELFKNLSSEKKGRFAHALEGKGVSLIAEIKKASPSKGILRKDFDPGEIAVCYEKNGAAAISVLTDSTFFQGSMGDLRMVRKIVGSPLLCKEFIIDPYQIYEAVFYGADAVLLITAVLGKKQLDFYLNLAHDLGLDALVEVHSREELEIALKVGAKIIGINNRDLYSFRTDLQTTFLLAGLVPDSCLLVSESGISTEQQIKLLAGAGVDAVLVGEALMTSSCLALKVRELAGSGKGGDADGLD